MKIIPIKDDEEGFKLVELRETPHCKKHGAMLKVSPGKEGLWRCIRATSINTCENPLTDEYEGDCRAGCKGN